MWPGTKSELHHLWNLAFAVSHINLLSTSYLKTNKHSAKRLFCAGIRDKNANFMSLVRPTYKLHCAIEIGRLKVSRLSPISMLSVSMNALMKMVVTHQSRHLNFFYHDLICECWVCSGKIGQVKLVNSLTFTVLSACHQQNILASQLESCISIGKSQ